MRQLLLPVALAALIGACAAPQPSPSPTPSVTPSASATPSTAATASSAPSTPAGGLPAGVSAVIDLAFTPSGIASDGTAIWAEDHASTMAVYAVDPETGETLARFALSRPCDVAVGLGRVWALDLRAGTLLAIDATLEASTVADGLAGPCGVQIVDGALWFAVDDGLARVDPETFAVAVTELGGAAFPGSGAPLWVSLYGSGELVRIDTATGAAVLNVAHPGGPVEVAAVAAGHGSLWVGGSDNRVFRLNPETAAVEAEIATSLPSRLLVTDTGVWLTSYEDGVVERIDPAANEVVFRTRLGGNPNGIAAGFGSIWVANTGSGELYRIDPAAIGISP